jgi:hypothetical protein
MEMFNIMRLKKFCADTIENEKLPEPEKIELLDAGMTPVCEMKARKNEDGVWVFPMDQSPQVLASGPFTVRFSCKGIPPVLRDFIP